MPSGVLDWFTPNLHAPSSGGRVWVSLCLDFFTVFAANFFASVWKCLLRIFLLQGELLFTKHHQLQLPQSPVSALGKPQPHPGLFSV